MQKKDNRHEYGCRAFRQMHDLLYLDAKDGTEFYNPDKTWDADTLR